VEFDAARAGWRAVRQHRVHERQTVDIFATSEPRYILSASLLPMQWFYQWHDVPHENGHRHIEGHQGLLIVARVHGHIHRFDLLSLLQVLTTSMVLLALAGVVTDMLMVHCAEFAKRYQLLSHEPSQQFSRVHAALAELKLEDHGDDACTGQDLLSVFMRIEQRLDRLDVADEFFSRHEASDLASAPLNQLEAHMLESRTVSVPPL